MDKQIVMQQEDLFYAIIFILIITIIIYTQYHSIWLDFSFSFGNIKFITIYIFYLSY